MLRRWSFAEGVKEFAAQQEKFAAEECGVSEFQNIIQDFQNIIQDSQELFLRSFIVLPQLFLQVPILFTLRDLSSTCPSCQNAFRQVIVCTADHSWSTWSTSVGLTLMGDMAAASLQKLKDEVAQAPNTAIYKEDTPKWAQISKCP